MNNLKLAYLFLIGLCGVSSAAFAQGSAGTRGGGDILKCGPWLGAKTIHLADTYQLKMLGALTLNTGLEDSVLTESYLKTLKAMKPELGGLIEKKLGTLTFIPVKKVEELEDDDLEVPSGCSKKQLAVQDISTGQVRYHEEYYSRLTWEEQALFKIHEAFIAVKKKPGETTTAIRQEVASIPSDQTFKTFLVDTLLKHKLVPDFKWEKMTRKITDFWVMSFYMKLQKSSFREFCSDPSILTSVKASIYGEESMSRAMLIDHLYKLITIYAPETYYGKHFYSLFPTVLERSSSVMSLSENMQAAQGEPEWSFATEVNLAKMEDHLKLIIGVCSPFKQREAEIFQDFKAYSDLVNAALNSRSP